MDMIALRRNLIIGSEIKLDEYLATGNPVQFTTDVRKNLTKFDIEIVPIQTGTGTPSVENPRPITGINSVVAYHTGLNLLDPSDLVNKNYSGDYSTNNVRPEHLIPVIPGSLMYLNGPLVNETNIRFYDRSGNLQSGYSISIYNQQSTTFAVYSDSYFILPKWYQTSEELPIADVANSAMVSYGTTVAEYVPYIEPTTYSFTFPVLGKNLFDRLTGIQLEQTNLRVARNVGQGVPFHMKGGTTYSISVNSGTKPSGFQVQIPYTGTSIYEGYGTYLTCTPEEDIDVALNAYWTTGRPEDATDFQIEYGGTGTYYEPYTRTCYGGTMNVLTGVLNVTHACHTFSGSAKDGFRYETTKTAAGTTRHIFNTNILDRYATKNNGDLFYASIAKRTVDSGENDLLAFYNGSPSYQFGFYIKSTECEDAVESFNAWLAEHPCQVVFPLAEPFDVQLDPATVKTIVGTNTIYNDAFMSQTVKYLKKESIIELYDATLYPITNGRYIDDTGGVNWNSNCAATIDLIPCEVAAGKKISLNKRPTGTIVPCIAFYSATTDGFISAEKNNGATADPWIVDVPATAKYVRFTTRKDATDLSLTVVK